MPALKTFLLSSIIVFVSLLPAMAAEDAITPSEEVIVRLLALRDERPEKDYTVAVNVAAESEFDGVRVAESARVIYFGPQTVKGSKVRRKGAATFLWSERYGWFLCKTGKQNGRVTIFIWSETEGEVEID